MSEGRAVDELLTTAYRPRRLDAVETGRIGAATWGVGRGAAPPHWREPRSNDPER